MLTQRQFAPNIPLLLAFEVGCLIKGAIFLDCFHNFASTGGHGFGRLIDPFRHFDAIFRFFGGFWSGWMGGG